MFECGLEGIKLKIVKRSQFEKGENGQDEVKNETETVAPDTKNQEETTENTEKSKKKHLKCVHLQFIM